MRVTPQLEAVLDYLLTTGEHPSARKIHEVANRRVRRISLATVYNLLNKLQKENVIGVLEFDEMENRYDGDTSHHWNLVCLGCRKIVDYRPVHTIDQEQLKRATRFEMVRSRIDLYGYCHECARKKTDSLKGGNQGKKRFSQREDRS